MPQLMLTYNNIYVVHATGSGQRVDPVRDKCLVAHRQQRLGDAHQVSESSARVRGHIPLEPGSVASSKNYGFH